MSEVHRTVSLHYERDLHIGSFLAEMKGLIIPRKPFTESTIYGGKVRITWLRE